MHQLSTNRAILNTMENCSQPFYSRADMYEYRLVANTDQLIGQQLLAEKAAFFERYKTTRQDREDGNLTIMRFIAAEAMEDTIGKWMQRICSQHESFIVTLNNYGGSPPGNIHFRVQFTQAFQLLGKELRVIDNYIKSYGLPAASIYPNPHITLASQVPAPIYTKAMLDYAQRDFHDSFIVKELVLLKRKNQFDAAKKINIFRLVPALETTENRYQLSVF